jgi:DNA-binding SARP family transcriptional activator
MLNVRLFGAGQASYCDRPLAGFPYQQSYLLLCYLLLNRDRPHHRERLAAVFWGEHSTEAARKSLRNGLWRLRHAFQAAGASADEYVLVDDDSASFSTASPHWLDIEVFETTVARHRSASAQDLTLDQSAELERAVELYTGDLLEGIYEDWCLPDRERLSLLNLNTLAKLMAFHEAHGNYERGLAYGQCLLDRDDTREKIHRRMMRLHWLMGDQYAALEQYRRCEQILREELGVAPADETRQLYQNILHNRLDLSGRPVSFGALNPAPATIDEPSLLTAERLADRIRRLHAILADASLELSQIEHLINGGPSES